MTTSSSNTADANTLDSHQAVLEEITTLLADRAVIDEAHAKRIRKAAEALRGTGEAADGTVQGSETGLDLQIEAGLEKLRTRIHRQVERRKQHHDRALELLDTLERAVRENELQKAIEAEKKLQSMAGNIPGLSEQHSREIASRLEQVRPQLRKLESWRHWGTTQAREELIRQVRELIDSSLHPEKIATTVKEARAQWQAWDTAGDQPGKELWTAFDQACEAAYRPCTEHFEKLRQERAENLRQRRALIENLNRRFDSIDWKHPDWRDIDRFVRRAQRDYRSIGNVEYRQRKSLEKAFGEILAKYEDHLTRERAHSFRMREKLVSDIEALAAVDNLREALDTFENLKPQWEVTVAESRRRENSLWKRYQAACDTVYKRRDAERREQQAGRNDNLRQKQAIIGELTAAAQTGDGDLLARTGLLAQLEERWRSIGQIPRAEEKHLERNWREARQQYRKAVDAAGNRARTAGFVLLARHAAFCNRQEQAVLAGETSDTEAVSAAWRALPELTGATADAISVRFSRAMSHPGDDTLAENLAIKQDACLRLEVILDLPSPDDCQSARMAYQVTRLNATMQKDLAALDSPEDLLLTALTSGAVPAAAANAVEQRINRCLARFTGQPDSTAESSS